jgi:nucleotide-binding universal stress UspA family protein
MRDTHPPSRSVVVGIDGSRSGLTAALWAVDEAVHRDLPLRLVYAIDPQADPVVAEDAARRLATAEIAVRQAFTAVESTAKPVKIEVEILQGRPTNVLREASRGAAMVCIGAIGLKHATGASVGSTAAALAAASHCPIAIVRRHDPRATARRSIVVEVDKSPDSSGVLDRGVEEALLREAPLVVISTWRPNSTDRHGEAQNGEQNHQLTAELSRRLARTVRKHPDLEVRPIAVRGNLLDHLARHSQTIQLVVIGRRRARGVTEIVGPSSEAALHDTDCSVFVCDSLSSL